MRQLSITSHGAEVRFIGFDRLQELAIQQSRGQAGQEADDTTIAQIYVHALSTANFKAVMETIAKPELAKSRHFVVSTVSNLALLGISETNFPQDVAIMNLSEFTEALLKFATRKISYEDAFVQASPRSSFFEQTLLTPPQLQLLIHISTGYTNTDISKLMFLTEKGVESAIKRLSLKLDCEYSVEKPQNLRIILGRRYAQMLGLISE